MCKGLGPAGLPQLSWTTWLFSLFEVDPCGSNIWQQSTLSYSLNFWYWMMKSGSWTTTNHFKRCLAVNWPMMTTMMSPLTNACLWMMRTVTHGGHLGDCWHRQQIYALIERFLGPSLGKHGSQVVGCWAVMRQGAHFSEFRQMDITQTIFECI